MNKPLLTTLISATLLTGGFVADINQPINTEYTDTGSELVTYVKGNAVVIDKTSPTVALTKWGGKEVLQISVGSGNTTSDTVGLTDKIENQIDSKQTVVMEPTEDGFNIDIRLAALPDSNVFTYQLTGWEDLDFFYQPPLNEEVQPKGDICTATECTHDGVLTASRAENIVGSYAVYSKHTNHLFGETNYETGKLGHIYRPLISDSNGQTTWGTLNYDNGLLSVTVPQEFLDSAVYPVLVDPTFGYSTVGATGAFDQSDLCVGFTSPETGNISSISSYGDHSFGDFTTIHAMYSDSGNSPTNLLAQDNGVPVTITSSAFFSTNVSYSMLGSTIYWICEWNNGGNTFTKYDTGTTGQNAQNTGAAYPTWPSPFNEVFNLDRVYSIYATYTVAASAATPHIVITNQTTIGGGAGGGGSSLNGFSFARSITVNSGQATSTQTNFPMLVSGTYSYLATTGNGGNVTDGQGDDIGFYSNSNCATKLDWEVELYTATSGLVAYWVEVPSLVDATAIYLCYGNAAITTDQSNKTGVWDANYKGVYHLSEGTGVNSADSTSNGNTAVPTTPVTTTGKIGKGLSFNGTDGQDLIGADLLTSSGLTMSMWITPTTANTLITNNGGNTTYSVESGNNLIVFSTSNARSAASSITFGTTYFIVATRSTGNLINHYINGVLSGTADQSSGVPPGGATQTSIGANVSGSSPIASMIDEVRISASVRSTSWIATEYNNQSSPSSFYTVGSAVAGGGSAVGVGQVIIK